MPAGGAGSSGGAKAQQGTVKIIPLARANNVSIMLTQFSGMKGPSDIRRALFHGTGLSLERLSLLLQARLFHNSSMHEQTPLMVHHFTQACLHAARVLLDLMIMLQESA